MGDARLSKVKHDLANPLTAVLAETELLLMRAEELPPHILESLQVIETAALRMRALLREME